MGLMGLMVFLISYPEILASIATFFFIRHLRHTDGVPINWPIVGMLPSLLLNVHRLHDWFTDMLRSSGHTFVVKGPWFSGMNIVLTCDPSNIQYITKTNFSNYPKGSEFTEIFDILGDGLLSASHDSWRFQRKIANTLINHKNFRLFAAKASHQKVEKGLVPVLGHIAQVGKTVDLQDVLQRFTFDSTCTLVFGIDPGCLSIDLPSIPFAKATDDAEEVLLYRQVVPKSLWKLQRWLRMGEERKMAEAWEIVDDFITEHISKRRQELRGATINQEDEEADAVDLLTSYMGHQVEDEMGPPKSDKFLRDTTLSLLAAGKDSTGAALTWFFWMILKNPSVEMKILEELSMNFGEIKDQQGAKRRVVFESEELGKLVYLHAALCESLRLFPPAPLVPRSAVQPDVLPSGVKVQAGTKVLYSTYALGRMEEIWGHDCLEYKPERWISKWGTLKYDHSKFLAFSAGPRICLGKDIAFVQMKAVVAATLYNFHVDAVPGQCGRPKPSVLLPMQNGLMVRLRERCA